MTRLIGLVSKSILVLILLITLIPLRAAHGLSMYPPARDIPELRTFVQQLKNGEPDELRGVYIADIMAALVVQQPAGNSEFVSPRDHIVTQYGAARRLGSIGLMAHNYLEGDSFSRLLPGRFIHLVYGDGRVSVFVVSRLLRYQAVDPRSPTSSFVDLQTGASLTSSQLFSTAYAHSGQVVFQTCIAQGNVLDWGRLFVIAEPYRSTEP